MKLTPGKFFSELSFLQPKRRIYKKIKFNTLTRNSIFIRKTAAKTFLEFLTQNNKPAIL